MQFFRFLRNRDYSLAGNEYNSSLGGIRRIEINRPQNQRFKSNSIKTSKYEIWSFLFLFLFEEFDPRNRIANVFFLSVCCLQCVPPISNTNGYPTTLVPLSLIVITDGIFAALEDYQRHKADYIANSSKARRYDNTLSSFVEVPWAEVRLKSLFILVYLTHYYLRNFGKPRLQLEIIFKFDQENRYPQTC